MAIFDISNCIIGKGRKGKEALVDWLEENVGQMYGSGDPMVVAIGAGWEIRVNKKIDTYTDDLYITWEVDITDEQKAVLFALKWLN